MTLRRLHSTGLCFLAFGIATACQLGCADRSDDDPGAGQTGSPVAPDYETPVPFRTLPEQEPNRGPSPEVPRRLLRAPSRIASFKNGAVRAVANVGGVGIVEVQADGGAVVRGSLLADTEVQWVGSVESSLLAIAERLPDDARTETSLQTSFYAFADDSSRGSCGDRHRLSAWICPVACFRPRFAKIE